MVCGRREPQRAHVGHGPRAAIDGDIVAERRIAAGEGQVPIADRDRPAGPAVRSLAGPAVDGDARLIVDLDIADDPAAVGYRPDRGVLAGAVDGVARRAAREPSPPSPPSIMPLLVSVAIVPEFAYRRRRPRRPCRNEPRRRFRR